MKSLLLKDFYMIAAYCRSFLMVLGIFLLTFAVTGTNQFLLMFPVVLMVMIPITLHSYDEKSGWALYARAMPYNKRVIVSERYVLMLILLGVVMLLNSGVALATLSSRQVFVPEEFLSLFAVMLSIGILCPCITLPCAYRFGSEKGRIIFLSIVMLASLAFTSVSVGGISDNLSTPISPLWFPLAAALLLPVSYLLSVRFYERREP